MKKFIKHTAIFSVLLFILLNGIAACSLYFLRNSAFYKPNFLMNSVAETNFDYIVLGSSTGLTTLNTSLIDSITQLQGINLSMDDTSMSSHYLMLQHFLALNKTAKFCVLNFGAQDIMTANPEQSGNDFRFLSLVSKPYVYEYFEVMEKGKIKPLTLSKYAPVFGVGYYNAEIFYPSLLAGIYPEKRNRFDEKGNYVYPNKGNELRKEFNKLTFSIRNPYYKKIVELCKANNIELVFYQSPIFQTESISTQPIPNFINHSNLLDSSRFFYDISHVNSEGREAASRAFAQAFLALNL